MTTPQACVQSAETWKKQLRAAELGAGLALGPGCSVLGFMAKFALYGLEKMRQAMTQGIKTFKANFYLGVVTEDGVVIGIQFCTKYGG